MGMLQRVRNLFQRERINAEIEEELRSHLDMATADALGAGMSSEEARRTVRVRFGNPRVVQERAHEADVALGLERLYRDVRQALRQLRKSPGFSAMAVLTLALGIGATTTIFTLVYDVMLKPLQFAQPDQLVTIQEKVAEWSNISPTLPVSANHFTFWQRYNRSFQNIAVMQEYSEPLGATGRPLQVGVLSATPGIFSVLEVNPMLGRPFTEAEAVSGHDHVVVLMDELWRNQFDGDPHVVGKTIRLSGSPYIVIGVMPPSFRMPSQSTATLSETNRPVPLGVLVPLAFSKERLAEEMGDLNYFGLGRLKAGVSVSTATADLDALQHTISVNLPADEKSTLAIALTPFQQELVGSNRKPLLILLGAVVGLLLVGCVNIANLLLARAVGQRQQMAIVAALGANRAEMMRMALRETIVLAIIGGVAGVLLAALLVPAMQRYLPAALDFRGSLHLDWIGAGCAVIVALITMLLAGAAPAWMVSRTAPQDVLHSEARLASESSGSRQARRMLVGLEVAVSVALLLTTGLLMTSLVKLMHVNRGFTVEQIMTATVNLPREQYPDRQHRSEFYREVLVRLDGLPGVEHAAITSVLPLAGDSWGDMAQLPEDTRPIMQLPIERFRSVSSEYFSTIQLPLISGQFFSSSNWGQNVAVISEKTANTLWPGKSPVGRQFKRAGTTDEKPFTVLGVVGDARTISLSKPDPMLIYVPYWYRCDEATGLVVRTRQDPASVANAILQTIWSVDRGAAVPNVRALGSIVADSVANQRFEMDLLLLFAGSALFLAGLGVYAVVTYSVVQRHREIGLRLALGASPGAIYHLVLRDGVPPIIMGAVAGVALAFAMARIVGTLLFDISPYDPTVALASAFVLLVVGIAACLIPARQAAAIESMQALRTG